MALDFKAVALTPLTDDHIRALDYPSSGWSTFDPNTLTKGRDFSATVLGMIASGGRG